MPRAEGLVLWVVSSVDMTLNVKARFSEIFRESYPTCIPYKSKVRKRNLSSILFLFFSIVIFVLIYSVVLCRLYFYLKRLMEWRSPSLPCSCMNLGLIVPSPTNPVYISCMLIWSSTSGLILERRMGKLYIPLVFMKSW